MEGSIRIGVGGWTFPPWRGPFYPKGLAHNRELHDDWLGVRVAPFLVAELQGADLHTSFKVSGGHHGAVSIVVSLPCERAANYDDSTRGQWRRACNDSATTDQETGERPCSERNWLYVATRASPWYAQPPPGLKE